MKTQSSLPPLCANILLAEDDRDNRIMIATLLRRLGANVDVAENGRIAVEMAIAALTEEAPYDLVLMDMQMPELDGYGATAQLRSCGYRGLVVAFTAHAMDRDRIECLGLGCDDYLSKPIDRARLREVVEKAISARDERERERSVGGFGGGGGGDDDIERATAEFAADLPARAHAIASAIAAGDAPRVRRLTHQLKGSAGSYGFPTVGDLASRIESAVAASSDDRGVQVLVAALIDACSSRAA